MVLKWRKQKVGPTKEKMRKLGAGFVHKNEPTQWKWMKQTKMTPSDNTNQSKCTLYVFKGSLSCSYK